MFSSAMSTRGASLPIQVEPAVESMAKTHWPAFKKVCRIAGDLKGGKGPGFCMVCNSVKDIPGSVV